MLQTLGIIALSAAVGAVALTICTSLFERRAEQLAAGLTVGAWIGVVVAVSASGVLRDPRGLAVFGLLFAAPFVFAGLYAIVVPGARDRLFSVPRRVILVLNILRMLGFLFVALALTGQLSGPFPWWAGIGDMIVGIGALALLFDERHIGRNDARLLLWNTVGLIDLVGAVTLGLTSTNGSPLQLFHVGVGSAAITELPWSMIPLFLVPCYIIEHVIIFAQMRLRQSVPA